MDGVRLLVPMFVPDRGSHRTRDDPRCAARPVITTTAADRRFCAKCGSHLGALCAACGTQNEPDATFCGNCGGALGNGTATPDARPYASGAERASASLPTGERRQLTVLFCDLVGSTPLSQQLDAEEWRDVVDALPHDRARRRRALRRPRRAATSATGCSSTSAGRRRARTTPSARSARGSRCSTRWGR